MLSEWCVLLSNKLFLYPLLAIHAWLRPLKLIFNRLIIKNPYINRSKEVILCVILYISYITVKFFLNLFSSF